MPAAIVSYFEKLWLRSTGAIRQRRAGLVTDTAGKAAIYKPVYGRYSVTIVFMGMVA